MSKAGRSAQARSESLRDRRRQRFRRRWPVALIGVAGAFAFGFFLPGLIMSAASSFLNALLPDSPGMEEPNFLPNLSLALGTVMAGAAAVGLVRPSRSEAAWRTGASGERQVGKVLDGLGRNGIYVLHDRTIPGSRANIDHIAVTPSGVFTVETKRYTGRLEVRSRSAQLWVNRSNRSDHLEQARHQTHVVKEILAQAGFSDIPVTPVLCFVKTTLPLLMPKRVGGVMICTPKSLRRRLLEQLGEGSATGRTTVVTELLEMMLRPAGTV